MGGVLTVLVPAAAEMLLLGLCVGVAMRLRRLRIGGVYQLTLAGIALDGVSQAWQLWLRVGRPAGVAWLLHLVLCYMMPYILLRLGELLARLRGRGREGERERVRVWETGLAEEGGWIG